MLPIIRRIYEYEIRLLSHAQPVLLCALRLYWGYQFFITGRGKLMNIERTTDFFESLHIPMPQLNAYMAGLTECVCGLLLLIGLASRITTIPLIVTMVVAYGTAHTQELAGLLTNPDGFVSAPPFLFLLASLIVLVFGPGWISADGLIKRFVRGQCSSSRHSTNVVHPSMMSSAIEQSI
jgi:putative oxidoreductase